MNKREKEVLQLQLEAEEDILAELEKQYKRALKDIDDKIKLLQTDELTQSRIYQIEYQKALRGQIEGIIEKLHGDNYTSLQRFLKDAYTDAFVGTAYNLAGQGIPLIMPIDQNAAVKAIINDSKIKEDLYTALGVDAKGLKKSIRQEITRGIASGMHYQDIARNISDAAKAPLSRAKTIAKTESHRIQQASTYDAQKAAKAKGADVVKQWDSTLDGRTRSTHRHLDGQIKEVEEPFKMDGKEAMFPGEFGDPAEDCNCRCVSLTRARWALDDDELKTLQERAEFFGLDKTEDFADYKKKYLKAVENSGKSSTIKSLDIDDFEIMASTKDITPEVTDIIGKTIKDFESQGGMYISEAHFGDFYDPITGFPALFQVVVNPYGLTEININSRILGGMTVDEINEIIAKTKSNLPKNLTEAVVHECGHAKAYYGKTAKQVAEMNDELLSKGVDGISKAASLDGAEVIAEVEVLLHRGAEVPEEAMKLYNEYVKGNAK